VQSAEPPKCRGKGGDFNPTPGGKRVFSAVPEAQWNFWKPFHVLPALEELKGCLGGRKAQNKPAGGSETEIINKFTLSG